MTEPPAEPATTGRPAARSTAVEKAKPIKVVPIFIDEPAQPEPPQPEVAEPAEPDAASKPPREKTPLLGAAAAGLALIAAVLQGVAIGVATAGDYSGATVLTYLAIALAIAAVVGGVVGVVLDRGRRWGILAIGAGLIANPLVLLAIFRVIG